MMISAKEAYAYTVRAREINRINLAIIKACEDGNYRLRIVIHDNEIKNVIKSLGYQIKDVYEYNQGKMDVVEIDWEIVGE